MLTIRWWCILLATTAVATAAPISAPPEGPDWRLRKGQMILTGTSAYSIALSPDARSLAIAGSMPHEDENEPAIPRLQLWSVPAGKKLLDLSWHDHSVPTNLVRFSPDGKILALAGGRNTPVTLLDVKTGKTQRSLLGTGAWDIRFAPNGDRLVCVSTDGKLHPYETASWNPLPPVPIPDWDKDDRARGRFSPDGTRYGLVTGKAVIHAWDAKSWKRQLTAHVPLVGLDIHHDLFYTDLAFSPDGGTLGVQVRQPHRFFRGEGGVPLPARGVLLLDAKTGAKKGEFGPQLTGPFGVTFSRGGRYAFTAGVRSEKPYISQVTVWDLAAKRAVQNEDCFVGAEPGTIALSADGRTLAVIQGGGEPLKGSPPGRVQLFHFGPAK